jgi:hypothetical protein
MIHVEYCRSFYNGKNILPTFQASTLIVFPSLFNKHR